MMLITQAAVCICQLHHTACEINVGLAEASHAAKWRRTAHHVGLRLRGWLATGLCISRRLRRRQVDGTGAQLQAPSHIARSRRDLVPTAYRLEVRVLRASVEAICAMTSALQTTWRSRVVHGTARKGRCTLEVIREMAERSKRWMPSSRAATICRSWSRLYGENPSRRPASRLHSRTGVGHANVANIYLTHGLMLTQYLPVQKCVAFEASS